MPEQHSASADMAGRLEPAQAYERLGGVVRQLHDSLRALGYDMALQRIANEIPDARDRLAYVGSMTEAAANKVLNLVDSAAPACDEMAERSQHWSDRLAQQTGDAVPAPASTRPLMNDLADYVAHVASFTETQRSVLTDIMMAQDFQDLSGQVIGKIIDIITRTEKQLLDLLLHSGPGDVIPVAETLEGPQIPEKAMKQDDVDDLLASLGF